MTNPRPEWEDPRRVLARHGLHPKRALSQNFLVTPSVVERIAAALDPHPDERVVELGPGLGALTGALLARGARVLAVESDRDMLSVLEAELGHHPRLRLVRGDARTVDLHALADEEGGPVAVAGNLPYAITGAIFRHLVDQRRAVSRAVVMVQKEVRDRILATPGTKAYGALTVFVTAAYAVEPIMLVRPGAFHPPPQVASAVLRMVRRTEPLARLDDTFRAVVRAVFDARRKTLRNALSRDFDSDRVDRALSRLGIDPAVRGERLEVGTFDALAEALSPSGP